MKQQGLSAEFGVPSILGSGCNPDTLWLSVLGQVTISVGLSFFMAGEGEMVIIPIVKDDTQERAQCWVVALTWGRGGTEVCSAQGLFPGWDD